MRGVTAHALPRSLAIDGEEIPMTDDRRAAAATETPESRERKP
jgi:hypothetical protein